MKTVTLKNIKNGQLFIFGKTLFRVELIDSDSELVMCSLFSSPESMVMIANHALVSTLC